MHQTVSTYHIMLCLALPRIARVGSVARKCLQDLGGICGATLLRFIYGEVCWKLSHALGAWYAIRGKLPQNHGLHVDVDAQTKASQFSHVDISRGWPVVVVGFFPQFEMSEIFVPGDDVVKAAPPHMRRAIQPLPEPPVLGVFSCGTCGNQHTKVGCFTGEC